MESVESKEHSRRLPRPVKITEQAWPEGTVPVVSVFSWAYNHAQFIRESIESILMQETTFPVEIIIHDDASNDGTTAIIREYEAKYPQLFRNIIQSENQWSQGKSIMAPLRFAPRGDYIALSHGDDFWVSRDKLEKHVEVLRSHPNVLFCGGSCSVLDAESGKIIDIIPPEKTAIQKIRAGDYFPGDSRSPWIHTCTRIFPKSILSTLPEKFGIDTLMLHWLVTKYPAHEIFIFPDVVATYRIHAGGIWSGMDASTKDRALVGIYSKAASLHKGAKKDILLKRAIEHAELAAKSDSGSVCSRLLWVLKLFYLKSFRSVYHFFGSMHMSKGIK